ncbi:MAG: hypothetical protein ABI197_09230 [Granulicella sp.]
MRRLSSYGYVLFAIDKTDQSAWGLPMGATPNAGKPAAIMP